MIRHHELYVGLVIFDTIKCETFRLYISYTEKRNDVDDDDDKTYIYMCIYIWKYMPLIMRVQWERNDRRVKKRLLDGGFEVCIDTMLSNMWTSIALIYKTAESDVMLHGMMKWF